MITTVRALLLAIVALAELSAVLAVDCAGTFSSAACTVSCGTGQQILTFRVTTQADAGGAPCQYPDGGTISFTCNTDTCPTSTTCTGYSCPTNYVLKSNPSTIACASATAGCTQTECCSASSTTGPVTTNALPAEDSVATIVIPVIIPICAFLVCGGWVLMKHMRREKEISDAIELGQKPPEFHGGFF